MHVHTPASALQHSLGDDWDEYAFRLVAAAQSHNIVAIATADYFTLDGYSKLLGYYNQSTHALTAKSKTAELFIVPGVELRLNIFNSLDDSINLHVLFDPESCSVEFIRQNFLEELKISYRGATLNLKLQNLLAIGRSIAEGSTPDYGYDFNRVTPDTCRSYVREALKAITLSYASLDEALKEIDRIFEKKHLPAKAYLVAVVGKGHGSISALEWFEANKGFSRAGLVREDLTHQADIIFSNDPADRKFYLGERSDTSASEIEARFSRLKPCVWGSDAKSLDTLLHPSDGATRDYTWIKADVSFEGLKQITYEPGLRVRVQQDNPSEEDTYAQIESLEIDFPPDLKIKDKNSPEAIPFCIQGRRQISLSSNLTCVIGGRGSGKSTLIHLLYNLIPDREIDRLSNVNSPLLSLQFGARDTLGKCRSLTKCEIPNRTEFFLQNEVEKFARDIDQMSTLVRARLYALSGIDDEATPLSEIEKDWQSKAAAVDELIAAWDHICRIDKEVGALGKQKDTLKKQTEVIQSEEYGNLQKEISEFAGKISAFESYAQDYKRISNEIATLAKSLRRLNWSAYSAGAQVTELAAELERRKTEIQAAFEADKLRHDTARYQAQLANKRAELKEFLKKRGLSPENIGELATASEQVAELESKIQAFEQEKVPYSETYAQKTATLQPYAEAHATYKNTFTNVAEKLQQRLENLKFDDQQTQISFQLGTNDGGLKESCADFVKQNNPSRVSLRSDDIQSVIFGDGSVPVADIVADAAKLVEMVNNSQIADLHTQILKQMINDAAFVEKLHLRLQRIYFDIGNIHVQTKLGDKFLQNTSFGERCGIVIAIVLVAGTNPIVMDQPEDNLDGKYISKVLVPLIRDQKMKRQIVLVTRDANIVMGGDAELVLILDKDSSGTKLSLATIENKELRPQYIWILDGGETAFRKREEKYAIRQGPASAEP